MIAFHLVQIFIPLPATRPTSLPQRSRAGAIVRTHDGSLHRRCAEFAVGPGEQSVGRGPTWRFFRCRRPPMKLRGLPRALQGIPEKITRKRR